MLDRDVVEHSWMTRKGWVWNVKSKSPNFIVEFLNSVVDVRSPFLVENSIVKKVFPSDSADFNIHRNEYQ